MLLLQHIAHGALRKSSLAPIVEVGVAPSICHLPPARRVRGVSHAMCLVILPLVIQTGGYLRPAVRIDEVQPWQWEMRVVGTWTFLSHLQLQNERCSSLAQDYYEHYFKSMIFTKNKHSRGELKIY